MSRETFQSLRMLLMEKLDLARELTDEEILEEIDTLILERMRDSCLSLKEKVQLRQELFHSVRKLDVLQELIEDETVTEIMVNGPILTIRRFPDTPITMEKLIALGSLPAECAEFLKTLVRARYSMVIGGGTGSGKTTFLGALSNFIPSDERLITIEDNAELKIQGIENLVRLEAKMANTEGATSVTIRDLIKTALRMRPDRIVVGEVRGGEAVDMLQALNTGHEGSLSTAHANSAEDMLSRLETMTLMGVDLPLEAIRRQIASGVDILIHLGRMRDKSRKVLEITEICGFEDHEIKTRTLYQWQEGKGLVQIASLLNREKLIRAGVTI